MAQRSIHPYAAELEALEAYGKHARREVKRVKRNFEELSPSDLASLGRPAAEQVRLMHEAVVCNLAFVEALAARVRTAEGSRPAVLRDSAPSRTAVQGLLQTFVREWSVEGLQERDGCFQRLLGALDGHFGSSREGAAPRVLIPGAELGRLALEVRSRGFEAEACEGRPLYFYGSELLRGAKQGEHRLQVFANNTCNRFAMDDHLRVTPVPDVDVGEQQLPAVRFGEFLDLYGTASSKATFDGALTAFALDSSSNIFRYVRTMAHSIRPGGVWANFGPLAYDNDHDEAHGQCFELSWEELRHVVSHFFDISKEEFVDALHAANANSMMQVQYSCVHFIATRNETPAEGIGEQ